MRCLTPIAAGFAPTVYTVPISRAKPLTAEAETKTTAILLSVRLLYYIVFFAKLLEVVGCPILRVFVIKIYYENSERTVSGMDFGNKKVQLGLCY